MGDDCKDKVQRSLAAIIGEIGLLRLAYGHSDYLEFYLKVIEEEAHKMFDACEKCNMKGGESCIEQTTE
jgi:hypothetical protein